MTLRPKVGLGALQNPRRARPLQSIWVGERKEEHLGTGSMFYVLDSQPLQHQRKKYSSRCGSGPEIQEHRAPGKVAFLHLAPFPTKRNSFPLACPSHSVSVCFRQLERRFLPSLVNSYMTITFLGALGWARYSQNMPSTHPSHHRTHPPSASGQLSSMDKGQWCYLMHLFNVKHWVWHRQVLAEHTCVIQLNLQLFVLQSPTQL